MVIYISLLVAVIGGLLFLLIPTGEVKAKIAQLGFAAFQCGLLAFLLYIGKVLVGHT